MFAVASDHSFDNNGDAHLRHARMKRQSAVLMSCRGDVWQTELEDISATGVLLSRPPGWGGQLGDVWVLDMLFGDELNIHVMAEVMRLSEAHIAFIFARIPEDKQEPLWNLLGGYADTLEPWND